MTMRHLLILCGALALVVPAAAAQTLKPVTVARGLVNPWGLAFLPDGRMLVSERPGRLRIVSPDGRLSDPLGGLPPVAASGQCGLLDVLPTRPSRTTRASTGLMPKRARAATAPRWRAGGWTARSWST
jgi:glucose/arabinose dehydrogenase